VDLFFVFLKKKGGIFFLFAPFHSIR